MDRVEVPHMNVKSIAVVAVIALVLSTGAVAAMPGSSPDHAADGENGSEGANDGADGNASDRASDANDRASDANDRASDAQDRASNASAVGPEHRSANAQGPVVDLPEQVPDHVAEIHALIGQFLDGDGEKSLGEMVSGVDTANASASTHAP